MSDLPALALLEAMFPGDAARRIPAASATDVALRLNSSPTGLKEIGALIGGDILPNDPNVALRSLRERAPDLVDGFLREAIVGYFADPSVARALTGKSAPLFPTHTVMPGIDFGLLEPVMRQSGHVDD